MSETPICPGRFKCHGPVSWCPECGDVDLICDDPKCDAHPRGKELEKHERLTRLAMLEVMGQYEIRMKEHAEAVRRLERYRSGNVVMVARQ